MDKKDNNNPCYCLKCKKYFPADQMHTANRCVGCRKEYMKQFALSRKEANAERQRKWREAHPEKNYQKVKEWREKNADKVRAYNKEYYQRRKAKNAG